ncbi:hypothetical protein LTR94_037941, partial [Friedmanniomyces endolithicus]
RAAAAHPARFCRQAARKYRERRLRLLRHHPVGHAGTRSALEARRRFPEGIARRRSGQGLCRAIFPARNQGGDGRAGQE